MEMTAQLLQLIAMMMAMILIGFLCKKRNLISQPAYKDLSNLLLLVVNPLLVLSTFQQEYDAERMRGLLISIGLSVGGMFILVLLARLLVPAARNPLYQIERFCASYPNCGFFGLPLAYGIFGAEGVFYITGTVMVFNVFFWTHGVRLVSNSGIAMTGKEMARHIFNPMILCCILGISSYLLRISYPTVIVQSITTIGRMNTPLAMLIIGGVLAGTNFRKLLANRRIYFLAVLRLLVLPLGVLLLVLPFNLREEIWVSVMIALAGPTATGCVALAIVYDNEPVYASEIVAITTILIAVTLPSVILLGRSLQGLLF